MPATTRSQKKARSLLPNRLQRAWSCQHSNFRLGSLQNHETINCCHLISSGLRYSVTATLGNEYSGEFFFSSGKQFLSQACYVLQTLNLTALNPTNSISSTNQPSLQTSPSQVIRFTCSGTKMKTNLQNLRRKQTFYHGSSWNKNFSFFPDE